MEGSQGRLKLDTSNGNIEVKANNAVLTAHIEWQITFPARWSRAATRCAGRMAGSHSRCLQAQVFA